jgi:hypothetical protein
LYHFDPQSRARFTESEFFSNLNEQERVNINSLIDVIYNDSKQALVSKSDIRGIVKNNDLFDLYQALSDPSYYALFDFFEVRQINGAGQRKKERVKLLKSRKQGTVDIFQTFFEQAKLRAKQKNKGKPTLIAITASSRDPFESADFYQGVLESFPAEVIWLPLDMNLQLAMEQNRCAELESIRNQHLLFDRARIYPNRAALQYSYCQNPSQLLDVIRQADGLFFNGGDQSRTIASLVDSNGKPSTALEVIRQALNAGEIVVAGTSAGTAVQAGGVFNNRTIPMLSNGDPKHALHRGAFEANAPSQRCSNIANCQSSKTKPGDLTYRASGGTGLFQLGLLDTHFSERDREIRLAVFAHTTETRYAFGVDETTALTVKRLPNGNH